MENKVPQYQRAVTPTIENSSSPGLMRGKVLSYNSNQRGKSSTVAGSTVNSTGSNVRNTLASPRNNLPVNFQSPDMNIQGRSTASRTTGAGNTNGTNFRLSSEPNGVQSDAFTTMTVMPRYDLVPLTEDIPNDGIVFAKARNRPETLIVFRTPEERLRNPERLNLDRRQLEACPVLEQEQRLRLLNFQNNSIRSIQNLENLPNLIFLDMYNNKIVSLDGPLSTVKGLRVLMAGKNRIQVISNLTTLRKLDVLDLHSNEIEAIQGLDGLSDLRVLNLAGNRISKVENLSSLVSLTELNLRRNQIESVIGLNKLPALQRVFLSHNCIRSVKDISCLLEVTFLIELSLDGNPLSEKEGNRYRQHLILTMPGLRHLDLRRITDEERAEAVKSVSEAPLEGNSSLSSLEVTGKATKNIDGTDTKPSEDLPITESKQSSTGDPKRQQYGGSFSMADAPSDPSAGVYRSQSYGTPNASTTALAQPGLTHHLSMEKTNNKQMIPQSLFDLEIIGPDEKAMVAVGDGWDWPASKRLLANVVEASLYHMKRQTLGNKFGPPQMALMPLLKSLRLISVDFDSLQSLDSIPSLFGAAVEHLIIKDCPVCLTTSPAILRSYLLAIYPDTLSTLNEATVTAPDRAAARALFAPVVEVQKARLGFERMEDSVGDSGASVLGGLATAVNLLRVPKPPIPRASRPLVGLAQKYLKNAKQIGSQRGVIGKRAFQDKSFATGYFGRNSSNTGGEKDSEVMSQFRFGGDLSVSTLHQRDLRPIYDVSFEKVFRDLLLESVEELMELRKEKS